MHLNNVPNEKSSNPDQVKAAEFAIMFSESNHDADISDEDNNILSTFFDNLKLDNSYDWELLQYGLGKLNFQQAMNVFDINDRWVYIGCSTLPPCNKLVYWNVLR